VSWASDFLSGHLPYRDVSFDYPPFAAVPFSLVGLPGSDPGVYRISFAVAMFAAALLLLWCTGRVAELTAGNRPLAMVTLAAAPLILGTLVRGFFDLVPISLIMAGLVLALTRRPAAAGAALGLGAMVKGFPLFALPPTAAWVAVHYGRREAARAAIACGATVAVLAGPGWPSRRAARTTPSSVSSIGPGSWRARQPPCWRHSAPFDVSIGAAARTTCRPPPSQPLRSPRGSWCSRR
jgi:Glycosyltransferase family 87